MLKLNCEMRQCGVLLSYQLSVYVKDIIKNILKKSIGCVFRSTVVIIILSADKILILLLAPSVDSLQRLVSMCEHELGSLELSINGKKSVFTTIGLRCNVPCCDIFTMTGAS